MDNYSFGLICILVVPEIAYSCLLRARDKIEDCIAEL